MFQRVIQHDAGYEKTLRAVRCHRPASVVVGCESGVELAERLANELGLPANGATLCAARRDKSLMAEAVSRQGLRTARQFLSDDIEAIINWSSNTLDWPVIVKPPGVWRLTVSTYHGILLLPLLIMRWPPTRG